MKITSPPSRYDRLLTICCAVLLAIQVLYARDETDLDALTGELARVVQETLQPEGVSVWLREFKRGRFS